MIRLIGFAVVAPVVAAFTYRRAGLTWARSAALAALALALTVVGGAAAAFADYAVSIETSLCGTLPAFALVAGGVAYLVLASWAALAPRRVWAWPLALWSAVVTTTVVAYFDAGAHHYCET